MLSPPVVSVAAVAPAEVLVIAPPLPATSASEPIVLLKPPRSSVPPLPTANAEFDEKPEAERANNVPDPETVVAPV